MRENEEGGDGRRRRGNSGTSYRGRGKEDERNWEMEGSKGKTVRRDERERGEGGWKR
jgi:hypothetical protein